MSRVRKKRQDQLLQWYRVNRREMPWRARDGQQPDPYHVWLSEIMLQQTTVAAVKEYYYKFIELWSDIHSLSQADLEDVLAAWAGLGYYARARNLHKCAQAIVSDHGGAFPEMEDKLKRLPGIGPYTAAAISSIAFNHQAVAVDGNVERVVSRFFAIEEPLPASKKLLHQKACELGAHNSSPTEFTQAFMELGATVCTPRNPKCELCPWARSCQAKKQNIAATLPRKLPKKAKPLRYGHLFWVQRADGRFLIEKRSEKGLYAGMYQIPTTHWKEKKKDVKIPDALARSTVATGLEVRHSFTHFDLVLDIWSTHESTYRNWPDSQWISEQDIERVALPSLMKKAIALCLQKKKM